MLSIYGTQQTRRAGGCVSPRVQRNPARRASSFSIPTPAISMKLNRSAGVIMNLMNTLPGPTIQPGVPALILAPMEGVTDAPMRALLSELGGFTFCVSEFLRITQGVPGPRAFRDHVPEVANDCRTPTGLPVQLQLLGGHPERLAAAAVAAVKVGAKAVDLNFGCPAPTVNKHDGGAALLHHPCRIRDIVRAVRSALPPEIPVSAKLRLGWDDPEAIHVNADHAEQGGASWITIHGRTRTQGYRPPVYWKQIGAVRARLGIPVVANGDIRAIDDLRCSRTRNRVSRHFMLRPWGPGVARLWCGPPRLCDRRCRRDPRGILHGDAR